MAERNYVADKLQPFGTTIFAEMTRLANEHKAINLSQGFPDFEGPAALLDSVKEALYAKDNQYTRSMGHPLLVPGLAALEKRIFGLEYDPMTELIVTNGATECITAALIGLLNPKDEVILFEPFYDSYPVACAMAGATPRFVSLSFPDFALSEESLRAAVTSRTKLIVLNSPHNPSGKVFSRSELEIIAKIAIEHDLVVLTDEVYEHLTYDGVEHIPLASLPGMKERTLKVSSAGKTFSFTGWKIGWAFGPAPIVRAVQAAHQFITFTTPTPLQRGLGTYLQTIDDGYFDALRASYTEKRDFLVDVLKDVGFEVSVPKGTYFVVARFSDLFSGDDVAFAKHLVEQLGVATIPPSFFYSARPEEGRSLIRFAFCKEMATLEAARQRLKKLV